MIHNNKFNYKEYSRKTAFNGHRHYDINGLLLPSVTTILSATKSAETTAALDNWRDAIGHDEADRIVLQSTSIGSQMHDNLEYYLRDGRQAEGAPLIKMMTKSMINHMSKKLDEFWGLEVALFVEGLYAGTSDMTGVYAGEDAIIDFKNSRSMKTKDQLDDYISQLVAYGIAHDGMFGTSINTGVILMVTQDCQFREFIITGDEYQSAKENWLRRLTDFYDKYNV